MNAPRPITILGGGLAGLALGIGLRQAGVPVTIWEAGGYPRHKVCGEFLSGRGVELLERLGVEPVEARWARTVRFAFGATATDAEPLPQPALCVSRWQLDALLAGEFRRLGGELREHQRAAAQPVGEGTVRATGRQVEPGREPWRWFGLKVHARGVRMLADLELHLTGHEYIGLCRLSEDRVNVCGLFWRRDAEPHLRARWREWLRGPTGSALAGQMRDAVFEEDTFRSVGGLSLTPRRARDRGELCLGDALTMIPPLTGNGMSLALESAALAEPMLTAYARGLMSWDEARREVASACDRAFARRLRWAWRTQRLLTAGAVQRLTAGLMLRAPRVWRWLFAQTR